MLEEEKLSSNIDEFDPDDQLITGVGLAFENSSLQPK